MSVNVESAINRVFQEYKDTLLQSMDSAPRVSPAYAMEVPSSSRSTLHGWLADQSSVKEFLGKRKLQEMSTRHWEVVNRDWELSYGFSVNQIRDDLSGLVATALQKARSNAAKWARHEDLLCAAALELGTTANCYDGQYFFDTDHPVDIDGIVSGTFSNVVAAALSHSSVYTALKRLLSFKNPDGSPMVPPGAKIKLMHPGALIDTVDSILAVKNLTPATAYALFGTSGASENPLYQRLEPVTNQYLTSDTASYVVAELDGVKPIMFQRRQDVETVEQGYGSQLYFEEKKVAVGSDARYEATFTLPQLCIRIAA